MTHSRSYIALRLAELAIGYLLQAGAAAVAVLAAAYLAGGQ